MGSARGFGVRVALVVLSACGGPHVDPGVASLGSLSEHDRVAHVLSRLTFGIRAGDAERVERMGIDRWIEQQLRPGTIPDTALAVALRPLAEWTQPAATVAAIPPLPAFVMAQSTAQNMQDSAARAALKQVGDKFVFLLSTNDRFSAGKVIHAQMSDRQLLEVLSDFWENHFSVFSGKMPSANALIMLDRDALRPHALGKFRDLLGAVAHSPAMLYYLDNHLSTKRGLNENYARELLELHTLGADGGYTQKDVQEVARALTGWTIRRTAESTTFWFRPELHDTGSKVVLGQMLPPGRGIEDGEQVLDILAHHPSTAHHISFKLARRLVSDDPPAALVNRAAATFMRTDGDIAAVVRTIITSPEFYSPAAFHAKVKTPFELVVSMRRALDAPADTTTATPRLIAQLGQTMFGWLTPEGFPERGDAWMNSGAIYKRMKLGADVAEGRTAILQPDHWRDWSALANAPLDAQIDAVIRDIFGGKVDPSTRAAMISEANDVAAAAPTDGARRLRAALMIAFASPDFQRR